MFSCYHIILYSGLIDEWEWVCHSNHETECLLPSEQLYKAQYSEQKNTVQCTYENNPEKYPSGYNIPTVCTAWYETQKDQKGKNGNICLS